MPAPANLVHQTTTTTGTGNKTLSVVNGKQSFNTAFGNGATTNVFDVFLSNRDAAEWMRGTGHMSNSTTLVVDTVLEGTNGTSQVSFSAGTIDVVNDIPAAKQLYTGQNPTVDNIDIIIAQLAMAQADLMNVAQFLGISGNRLADSFDALTYVNTGAATNLDSGTAGLLKNTTSGGTLISQATGSVISDFNAGGATSVAFDSNTNQVQSAVPQKSSASAYIGKDYHTSAKTIGSAKAYGSNNGGHGAGNLTITIYGKNGSAPTTPTDGTSFGTTGSFADTDTTDLRTITSTDLTTAWDYVWLAYTSSSNFIACAEAEFYSPVVAGNITVKSTGLTAASAPSSMKIVAMVKHVDSATAGTDYKFKVARDGTNLSGYLTLNDRFTVPGGGSIHVIESDAIDVTGITTGTTPLWQWETFNNKSLELQAIYLYWT